LSINKWLILTVNFLIATRLVITMLYYCCRLSSRLRSL